MPADYQSTAQALALPVDETAAPARRNSTGPLWSRRLASGQSSQSPGLRDGAPSFSQRWMRSAGKMQRQALQAYSKTYNRFTPLQRAALVLLGLVAATGGILFLVYNEKIFGWLAPVAQKWRNIRGGWMILWAAITVVAFPPLIGYSSCLTIAGFVYGFPNGWYIAASATVVGSTLSFIVSRTVLSKFVNRLVAEDKRFAALSLTLKHDGLKLLCMIRLCPLPYSLSNGAIATIPTVSASSFALATALISPKLMLHIFVGSRIGALAENGGEMDAKTKAISYASIVIGALAGVLTGWLMYRQTKRRAAQLEREEAANAHTLPGDQHVPREYADGSEREAVAALRGEDEISLHTTGFAEEYRDEFSEDEDAQDVFRDGDGDDEEAIDTRK